MSTSPASSPPPTPTSTPPTPPGRAQQPDRKPLLPAWLWWVFLAGTVVWNLVTLFTGQAQPTLQLPYTTFVQQVQAGNVSAVTVAGQSISGTFVQPTSGSIVPATPANGTTTAPTPSPTAADASAVSAVSYLRFNTVMPAFGDDQLLPLLEQRGVVVSVKDTSGGNWLLDLAVSVLPTAVLVGLLLLMARQAQRGQQSIFGFGASRARRYTADRSKVTFADVAGEDQAKADLLEIVDFLKQPGRYRELGARLPRGVLLIGPPGTGKTLLARAVAGEANVPFFSISASEFVEVLVGVGASRVRDLFAKAKAEGPAIIFVDEIDAIGRQRGSGMLAGANDEREQTLNQLLVEMDGFDADTRVIVLAATNRPDVLDPALLRPGRFDRQVTVGLPDRAGRQAILEIHTRELRLDPGVSLDLLARRTPGFSGADLANLSNEAALAAARRNGTAVSMADFDEALDRIVLGTRQAGLMSEDERRLVAYHEGGHALVARFTPGADPVTRVTIIPHGRALGVTQQLSPEDRHGYLKGYLVGRLAVMLGGRAAELLVFGEPATGAESDLKQASELARRMATQWAMVDDLGEVAYGSDDDASYGRGLPTAREYSEATAAELDRAVRRLLDEAYERASAILTRERPVLDALANELLAHESVDAQQLDALLATARQAAVSSDGAGGHGGA